MSKCRADERAPGRCSGSDVYGRRRQRDPRSRPSNFIDPPETGFIHRCLSVELPDAERSRARRQTPLLSSKPGTDPRPTEGVPPPQEGRRVPLAVGGQHPTVARPVQGHHARMGIRRSIRRRVEPRRMALPPPEWPPGPRLADAGRPQQAAANPKRRTPRRGRHVTQDRTVRPGSSRRRRPTGRRRTGCWQG